MIQTLAYIDPQAKIAANVVVEPYTVIHKNVSIGEGTRHVLCNHWNNFQLVYWNER